MWPKDAVLCSFVLQYLSYFHIRRSWHINNNTNYTTNVTYLITGETGTKNYSDISFTYKYEPCPRDGCIVIEEPIGPYNYE